MGIEKQRAVLKVRVWTNISPFLKNNSVKGYSVGG